MALGPHQIPYVDKDKVDQAEKRVDQILSDDVWVNGNVEKDGAKRPFWIMHVDGAFSELERGDLCQRYRDAGWGYVTTRNNAATGFDLELCQKEVN